MARGDHIVNLRNGYEDTCLVIITMMCGARIPTHDPTKPRSMQVMYCHG